jgi:hypothetical protein
VQTKEQYVAALRPYVPIEKSALGRLLDAAEDAGDTQALCDAVIELMPRKGWEVGANTPNEGIVRLRAGECLC